MGLGFDSVRFDQIRFDTKTQAAADTLALADDLQKRAALTIAETLTLTDAIRNLSRLNLADIAALGDQVTPRVFYLLFDTVSLADSILALNQVIQADTLSLADLIAARPATSSHNRLHFESVAIPGVAQTDMLLKNIRPNLADIATVADSLTGVVGSYRTSVLALADQITARHGGNLSDNMVLLDGIISALMRGAEPEALSMTDALAHRLTTIGANTITAVDSVQATSRPMTANTLTLADAIISTARAIADDLLTGLDAIASTARPLLANTITTTDGLAITTRRLLDDTLNLVDFIRSGVVKYIPPGAFFQGGQFDQSYFDAPTGEPLRLADEISIARGIGVIAADLLALADEIKAASQAVLADTGAATDEVAARAILPIAATLGLADQPEMIRAVSAAADTLALADDLQKRANSLQSDAIALVSAAALTAKVMAADPLSLAETTSAKVTAYQNSIATLADAIAAASTMSWADIVEALEGIAINYRRGAEADALLLTDEIIRRIMLTINDYAGSSNRCPDFSQWTLTGGAYIDETDGSLVLPQNGARATTPFIILGREASWWWSADYYSETEAAWPDFAGQAGFLQSSNYYNINGQVARNSANWSGNGNAQSYPMGQWTRRTWSFVGGDNVAFIQMAVIRDTTYSSPVYRIRNPKLAVVNDTVFTPYGITSQVAALVGAIKDVTTPVASSLITITMIKAIEELLGTTDAMTAQTASLLADSLTIGDDVARAGIYQAITNSLVIADDLTKKMITQATEALAMLDAHISSKAVVGVNEISSAADILQQIATTKTVESQEIINEALERIFLAARPSAGFDHAQFDAHAFDRAGDVLRSLPDAVSAVLYIARQVDDTAILIETIMLKIKVQAASVLVVADQLIRSQSQTIHANQAILNETITRQVGKQDADILALTDNFLRAVASMLSDNTSLEDTYLIGLGVAIAEAISLTDQGQAAVYAALASAVALTDDSIRAIGKTNDSNQPVSDHIIAALHMFRQAQSVLEMADATATAIRKILDEALATGDDLSVNIKAARFEAVELADLLGLTTTRPLPEDMIGVLDEAALRAAIKAQEEMLALGDDFSGWRRFVVLNQVFIEGVSIPVVGLTIHHAATDRVSSCSFAIPNPTPDIIALCRQRAEVHVYLTDGEGITDYFGGRITNNPINSHTSITTRLDITAHDYTGATYDVLVSERYTEGTLTDQLINMWTKYAPYSIDLSQVVTTDKQVSALTFKYDRLFDATEQIAQLLGYTWYVEWNGSHRILRFFPPSGAIRPIIFSRTNLNVVAGTARFGQDDKIVNRLYVFGSTALSQDFSELFVADGQRTVFNLAHRPFPPAGLEVAQVKVNGTPLSSGIDYPYWPDGKDVLVNHQGRFVRWRDDNKPASGQIIEVTYRYEYPVAVTLDDPASIARFGLVESKLVDAKIRDVRQAREVARQMLREQAFPKGYGTMEITEPGLRAGDFVTVDLQHLGAKGLFEVVEITKKVERNTVRRTIALNVADDPEARIAHRLKEFAKRIENLELKDLDDNAVLQKFQRIPESLMVSASSSVRGQIDTEYGDEIEAGEGLILVVTPHAVRVLDEPIKTRDRVGNMNIKAQKTSSLSIAEGFAFNGGFFDRGLVGQARFGFVA